MGVRQAAALHPGAAREDRRADRAYARPARGGGGPARPGGRVLLRELPGRAPDPPGPSLGAHRGAPARRDRPRRRGVRGVPARVPVGLPGFDSRDRHGRGAQRADRGAHEQPLTRAERGAQTALPASATRLSRPGGRAGDRAVEGAGHPRGAGRGARRHDSAPAGAGAAQGPEHRRDARLGPGARGARRRPPHQGAGRGDHERDNQVRPRRGEGPGPPRRRTSTSTTTDELPVDRSKRLHRPPAPPSRARVAGRGSRRAANPCATSASASARACATRCARR